MAAVLKSLAAAFFGMALFFCFFMLGSAPVLVVLARLHHQDAIYVAPTSLYRSVGLPLAGVAFAICFVLAMKKFRKSGSDSNSQPPAISRQ